MEGGLALIMPGFFFLGDSHVYSISLWGPNISDARISSERGSQFSKEKQLENSFPSLYLKQVKSNFIHRPKEFRTENIYLLIIPIFVIIVR